MRVRALATLLTLALPGGAWACQQCAIAIPYNTFRFLGMWNLLLLAWLVVTTGLWLFTEPAGTRPTLYSTLRPGLHFLLWPAVLVVFIVPGLFLMFLWPLALLHRISALRTVFGRDADIHALCEKPLWRNTNIAFLALAILSIPLAPHVLPPCNAELYVREWQLALRDEMRGVEQGVDEGTHATSVHPFLDPSPPAEQVLGRIAAMPLLSPFPWTDYGWPRETDAAIHVHTHPDGEQIQIWAQGPSVDSPTEEDVIHWLDASPDRDSLPIVDHIYDATNGTRSRGILLECRGGE